MVGLNDWVRRRLVRFWHPVAEESRRCHWSIGRDDSSDIDCLFLHTSSSYIALFCCIYSRSFLSNWYTPGIQKIAVDGAGLHSFEWPRKEQIISERINKRTNKRKSRDSARAILRTLALSTVSVSVWSWSQCGRGRDRPGPIRSERSESLSPQSLYQFLLVSLSTVS